MERVGRGQRVLHNRQHGGACIVAWPRLGLRLREGRRERAVHGNPGGVDREERVAGRAAARRRRHGEDVRRARTLTRRGERERDAHMRRQRRVAARGREFNVAPRDAVEHPA